MRPACSVYGEQKHQRCVHLGHSCSLTHATLTKQDTSLAVAGAHGEAPISINTGNFKKKLGFGEWGEGQGVVLVFRDSRCDGKTSGLMQWPAAVTANTVCQTVVD